MEHEIIFSIIKFLSYSAADFYVEFWRYSQISSVEEFVYVAPEQHAVSDIMGAAVGIWLDL
jgi:hypothetical protein